MLTLVPYQHNLTGSDWSQSAWWVYVFVNYPGTLSGPCLVTCHSYTFACHSLLVSLWFLYFSGLFSSWLVIVASTYTSYCKLQQTKAVPGFPPCHWGMSSHHYTSLRMPWIGCAVQESNDLVATRSVVSQRRPHPVPARTTWLQHDGFKKIWNFVCCLHS